MHRTGRNRRTGMTIELETAKQVALVSGIALLCASCTIPAPTLAPVSAVPTETASRGTPTPAEVPTVSADATPVPSPAMSGPYLIYRKNVDGQDTLVIMEADGKEHRDQPLPTGAMAENLANAVSPDGRWLAFHTGSAESPSEAGRFDLALNLMDLSNGQTQWLTFLLAADYPDNLHTLAGELAQQEIPLPEDIDPSLILRDALVYGIRALDWSPDGRYLAFAGQVDGLSSDVYVYDREVQAVRRLSDEAGQIQSITWSPDGRWVVYGSAHCVGAGAEIQYAAADVDGSTVRTLSSGVIVPWGWLGPSTLLQMDAVNQVLQSIDVETGTVRTLWNGQILSYALDPANDVLAIVGADPANQVASGLFLIDLSGGGNLQVAETASSVKFIGIQDMRFIATIGGRSCFVMADGTAVETGFGASRVQASPDLRTIAVLGETMEVYSGGNHLEREIALPGPASSIEQVIWRPDAPGLFFTLDSEMYALDWLSGEVQCVDEDVPGRWEMDAVFSRPTDIGPDAVWDNPADSEFADCHMTADPPITCVVAVMQAADASAQAITFTRLLEGHAFMLSFTECGIVDVTQVIFLPRPSDIIQDVLINGTPRVVYAATDLGHVDITQDPLYPTLVQQYPNLTIWESLHRFERMELSPDGGQRFIFRYDLVDGCHICRTGSSAFVAFDFDRTGQFLGTEFLYLEE